MPKKNHYRNQASQYDKIIKENLEVTLPVIIRDLLGLDILFSEELPDEVQHTKERKPDTLKKVTDKDGNTYILQIEFQVADEKEMVYRMAEYYIMLMRKYQLPIKQFVIFLKDTKPMMPTYLQTERLQFDFTLVKIAEVNYKLFLRSNNPEVKMLGILANFGKEDNHQVIRSIIEGVKSTAESDFSKNRFFKQLRIFVQLRNHLEQNFEIVMQSVSTFFKEENDFLYRKGEAIGEVKGEARGEAKGKAKGKEEGKEETRLTVVKNLILQSGSTDEQIAKILEVEIDYVKKIRIKVTGK